MPRVEWVDNSDSVICHLDGRTYFTDTSEHFTNAVLRLLGLDDESGRDWVGTVALAAEKRFGHPLWRAPLDEALELLARVSAGQSPTAQLLTNVTAAPGPRWTALPDTTWAASIGDDQRFAMIGSATGAHAWLVDAHTLEPTDIDTDFYEEDYFEGGETEVGYGHYLEQSAWRLEKGARQVRQVEGLAWYLGRPFDTDARFLDIGSGYGFFRKALSQRYPAHAGVEISKHASTIAEALFGFESFVGTLEDFAGTMGADSDGFDALTMWDCLEHVVDPEHLLATARSLLKPGGLVFVRTPNLLAAEREVFGTHYHSFKREHLHMFSAASFASCATAAGLEPLLALTDSHLLQGFLGAHLKTLAISQRGSDLLAVAQRSPQLA